MVRTQIYLTAQERDGLAHLTRSTGKKFSELVREAVNRLLDQSGPAKRDAVLTATAGLWKDRNDLPDFTAERAGWDRRHS